MVSRRVLVLAWLAGCAIVLPIEWRRFSAPDGPDAVPRVERLVTDWNLDTTPWLYLLLAAPLCFAWRGPIWSRRPAWADAVVRAFDSPSTRDSGGRGTTWLLAAVVAAASLAASARVATWPVDRDGRERFGDLPPGIHDEYSYLFQARTFLAGRLWFPSHPETPELFDQMHVLNEGKFASRYFPGAGAWLAPFLAIGHPNWGQWLAGAAAACAVFFAGCELGGRGTGFVAGMTAAVSPALALFSNLFLAHHPTLLGLTVFLAAFLRLMRRPGVATALLAGTGLSFAMLCRPLTAAGFALPFGLWMLVWLVRGSPPAESNSQLASGRPAGASPPPDVVEVGGALSLKSTPVGSRLRIAAALAAPLVAGLVLLFFYNRAITGDGLTTPYQLYTDVYTPRHVYGFNNVLRGERRLGPKVLDNYDRWALNLTPELAAENVFYRIVASQQWTLGIVPLAMALVLVLGGAIREERRWGLVVLAIVSLHALHVPYWFDGILHFHYVFETAPLWILVFAGATTALVRTALSLDRPAVALWWLAGGIFALATGWTTLDLFALCAVFAALTLFMLAAAAARRLARPRGVAIAVAAVALLLFVLSAVAPRSFWPLARLDAVLSEFGEMGFARLRYAGFQRRIDAEAIERPALVLVAPDPADRHVDFVTNDPALSSPVLIGRITRAFDHEKVRRAFPDRTLYRFDARTGVLSAWPSAAR